MKSLNDQIKEHPFTAEMSAPLLATLMECARAVEFQDSEILFSQGEVADRFFPDPQRRGGLGIQGWGE